jgi:hypothetical protein
MKWSHSEHALHACDVQCVQSQSKHTLQRLRASDLAEKKDLNKSARYFVGVIGMMCPFLYNCSAKVTYETYMKVCFNLEKDAYKECETYKNFASRQMTPSEWARSLRTA